MTTVNITEFKRNIGTYFDQIVWEQKPITIKRRNLKVQVIPINNKKSENDDEKILQDYAVKDYLKNTPNDDISWKDYIINKCLH